MLAIMLTLFACIPGKTPDTPDKEPESDINNDVDNTDNPFGNGGPVDLPIIPAA